MVSRRQRIRRLVEIAAIVVLVEIAPVGQGQMLCGGGVAGRVEGSHIYKRKSRRGIIGVIGPSRAVCLVPAAALLMLSCPG